MLKDDLIVRLDQFSSEMVILREEIKSLQTVKACLQLRISELEEEAKKTKEDLAQKTKKQEEDDVSLIFFLNFCVCIILKNLCSEKKIISAFLFFNLHDFFNLYLTFSNFINIIKLIT